MDGVGREVRLSGAPKRVISLAPHITEMVFDLGLGDRLVGTVRFSDWPPAAREVPRIGDAFSANVEAIVAKRPDLVLAWQGGGLARVVDQIESLGIPVYFDAPKTLDDIATSQAQLGYVLGAKAVGAERAAYTRQRLASLRAQTRGPRVRTFFQIADQNLYTVNGSHFIGQAITLCGGENVFAASDVVVPVVGVESVVAADPELIIISRPRARASTWERKWRDYASVKAVANNRIEIIDADLISRPGTRFIDGIGEMCRVISESASGIPARDQ